MRGRDLVCGVALAALLSPVLGAGGEPGAWQAKLSMCVGCHGIEGYRTAFPEVYSVPKLGGQYPEYIVSALKAYKAGERSHPTMQSIAAGLSEEDMAALAAYYGTAR
ncbi:c-type cytochrome [Thauera aromatica]|uniref:Cytochrome c553 n=1 Tax=Thauera aromatica K172 TaxID=44139 RepID=A0A2R4BPG6_THAAR|nr:cytochrome c [Thauera aromatica]AVR89114.1 Cytochrome c553 [Thauera aromatica K172]MCK2095730.1 cytochrome c [Thauera aromatica]